MTSMSIPCMSVGDHVKTSVFFDRNCLNSIFPGGAGLSRFEEFIQGEEGSTPNDSGSSSILLSGYPDSVVKSESGIPPNFDCY